MASLAMATAAEAWPMEDASSFMARKCNLLTQRRLPIASGGSARFAHGWGGLFVLGIGLLSGGGGRRGSCCSVAVGCFACNGND
mmetsp:Transcript_57336/g.121667  ORF Transcript_57336/g.121667 Transcript_57336/m.121667 type:complete len:84 (+) Transcript_57336:2292-2543(+)